MKNKIIFISLAIVIISTIGMVFFVTKKEEKKRISNDYIAAFKGENGQTIHTTYLYQKKKSKKKIEYKYINTISTLTTYDSSTYREEIIKTGKFKNKEDIFKISQENEAASFVKVKKEDKTYSFEEFKNIWK